MGVNTLCNDCGQDHVRMVSSSRVFSVWESGSVRVKLYKTPSDERRRHRREMQSPAIAFKIHIFVIWQFNLFLWQKQERNSQTEVMKVPVTINLTPSHRISWLYYATLLLWCVDTLTNKESTYRMNGSLTMDVADYIYPSINHSFIQKVWLCDVWHIEDIKQNMVS